MDRHIQQINSGGAVHMLTKSTIAAAAGSADSLLYDLLDAIGKTLRVSCSACLIQQHSKSTVTLDDRWHMLHMLKHAGGDLVSSKDRLKLLLVLSSQLDVEGCHVLLQAH